MNEELFKLLGTLAVSVGGTWVALHKKLENLATRLNMAEKNLDKVEQSHRADLVEVKSKIRSAEATLSEIRARTDVKTLLSQGE